MNHLWIYIGLAWFFIGLITTIIGCLRAKALSDELMQDEVEIRISFFTESDRTKQLREMYVQRRQESQPLDRIALAIKRERAELMAVRK